MCRYLYLCPLLLPRVRPHSPSSWRQPSAQSVRFYERSWSTLPPSYPRLWSVRTVRSSSWKEKVITDYDHLNLYLVQFVDLNMMVIRVIILCENELTTLINAICLFRVNNVQEQSLSGGTSDAALLAGVAELTAETCRTRLYRAHQRGQVMFCVIYLTNSFTDSGSYFHVQC